MQAWLVAAHEPDKLRAWLEERLAECVPRWRELAMREYPEAWSKLPSQTQ